MTHEGAVIHRTFADEEGRLCEVWDVTPAEIFLPNPAPDVRAEVAERPPVGEWERGWLAFHCEGLRRRLAPIPQRWERGSDEDLRRLFDEAQ